MMGTDRPCRSGIVCNGPPGKSCIAAAPLRRMAPKMRRKAGLAGPLLLLPNGASWCRQASAVSKDLGPEQDPDRLSQARWPKRVRDDEGLNLSKILGLDHPQAARALTVAGAERSCSPHLQRMAFQECQVVRQVPAAQVDAGSTVFK